MLHAVLPDDSGLITDIQHFSVHDGPGIRTLVFLKGCPLRCAWCANPETQACIPELGFDPARCLASCSRCLTACPSEALLRGVNGTLVPNRSRCAECLDAEHDPPCAKVCPSGALFRFGSARRVDALLDEVEKDAVFYRHQSGGLTLSGGEPLAQPVFTLALLRGARQRCLHTALETCGLADPELLLEVCAVLDFLFFDLKCADPDLHRRGTGVDNTRILDNLRLVRQHFPALPLRARTPVVPGFNADEAEIRAVARTAAQLGVSALELLPYHAFGAAKYVGLGKIPCPASSPAPGLMSRLREAAAKEIQVVTD